MSHSQYYNVSLNLGREGEDQAVINPQKYIFWLLLKCKFNAFLYCVLCSVPNCVLKHWLWCQSWKVKGIQWIWMPQYMHMLHTLTFTFPVSQANTNRHIHEYFFRHLHKCVAYIYTYILVFAQKLETGRETFNNFCRIKSGLIKYA